MNDAQRQAAIAAVLQHEDFVMRYSYLDTPTEDIAEQSKLLDDLLQRDPAIFLERYGKLLNENLTQLFASIYAQGMNKMLFTFLDANYKHFFNKTKPQKQTLNRRYQAMQQMMSEKNSSNDNYFSMESMRLRQPELFMEYVGNFKHSVPFKKDMKVYERLLYNFDLSKQEEEAEEMELQQASSDDDNDTTSNAAIVQAFPPIVQQQHHTHDAEHVQTIDAQLAQEQEQEFLHLMQMKFLHGEDAEHVDYKDIDNNAQFDNDDEWDRDAEEQYFDDDDASNDDTIMDDDKDDKIP